MIALRYIIGWASEASREDSDFHAEIPDGYVLDKERLEDVELPTGEIVMRYYPNRADIKVITGEMEKITNLLRSEREKAIQSYNKKQMK